MTAASARRGLRGAAVGMATIGLAAAGPAAAQALARAGEGDLFWWRWLGALGLCLALGVAGAFLLRARMQGRAPGLTRGLAQLFPASAALGAARRLRVVETVRASPQLLFCLVRLDGRDYLVAATPSSAVLLTAADAPRPAEAG